MKLLRALMLVVVALSLALASDAAAIKGWILKQTTEFRGALVVCVGPHVGKIISKDLGTISRTNSKVWLFNTQNKSYMEFSHKEFVERFGSMVEKKRTTTQVKESSTICGQKATRYHIVAREKDGSFWYEEDLWATRALPVDQLFIDECSSILDIPSSYGMPLKLVRNYYDKRHMVMIQTLDCKPAVFAQKDFVLDPSFKKVDDETKIMSSDTSADISDLMDTKPVSTGRTKTPPAAVRNRR